MKYLFSLFFILCALNFNVAAQENPLKSKEYQKLTKFLASEIRIGGKSFKLSKHSSAETVVSKVKFIGCDVEVQENFILHQNFAGQENSDIYSAEKTGEVTAAKKPLNTSTTIFNFKYLDASLFRSDKSEDKKFVNVILETKSEDREIERRSGIIPRFVSRTGFKIRQAKSEEVINAFKILTQMCKDTQ